MGLLAEDAQFGEPLTIRTRRYVEFNADQQPAPANLLHVGVRDLLKLREKPLAQLRRTLDEGFLLDDPQGRPGNGTAEDDCPGRNGTSQWYRSSDSIAALSLVQRVQLLRVQQIRTHAETQLTAEVQRDFDRTPPIEWS